MQIEVGDIHQRMRKGVDIVPRTAEQIHRVVQDGDARGARSGGATSSLRPVPAHRDPLLFEHAVRDALTSGMRLGFHALA